MTLKRIITAVMAFLLIASVGFPVNAQEQSTVVLHQEIDIGNGIVIVDEIVEYANARALGKAADRTRRIYDDGVLIGVITITGAFLYDGTTVTVQSMYVKQADTYEGWSYRQNSLTASGGTITLDAKLTKLLVLNIPFTFTLSCDANGNLS